MARLARDARAYLDSSGFVPCAVRTYHGHDRGTRCAVSLVRVSLPISHTRASPALSVSRVQRCARAEGHLLPGFLSDFRVRVFARGLLFLLARSQGSALVPTSWARWISHGPCDPEYRVHNKTNICVTSRGLPTRISRVPCFFAGEIPKMRSEFPR